MPKHPANGNSVSASFLRRMPSSAAPSFEKIATEQDWRIRHCEPFWELYSGNDEGKAVRYVTDCIGKLCARGCDP